MNKDMKLPDGKKCDDCVHCYRCEIIFGGNKENKQCDFYPIRFVEKKK